MRQELFDPAKLYHLGDLSLGQVLAWMSPTGPLMRPMKRNGTHVHQKPNGLWASPGDVWLKWLVDYFKSQGEKEHLHRALKGGLHEIIIPNRQRLLECSTFGQALEVCNRFADPFRTPDVPEWGTIAQEYDGVSFMAWQQQNRNARTLRWFRTVDVPSVCIWGSMSALVRKVPEWSAVEYVRSLEEPSAVPVGDGLAPVRNRAADF